MALAASGLGALGWWVFQSRSLQNATDRLSKSKLALPLNKDGSRKLNIGLRVEKVDAANSSMADPFATQLSVLPAPETPSQDSIISAQCVWQIEAVRYRTNANAPWHDLTPKAHSVTANVELSSPYGKKAYTNAFIPRYQQAGEWKSVVRAAVEIKTRDALWHGEVSHEFNDVLSAADLKQRAAQRVAAKIQRQNLWKKAAAPPDKGELVPGKHYIAKLQWSDDAGQSWRDAPTAAAGFVTLRPSATLGLRAVKADPNAQWPDAPEFYPYWKYQGKKYFGEQIFLGTQQSSRDGNDTRTATVYCGQQMTVNIRIVPFGTTVAPKSKTGGGSGTIQH